MSSGTGDLTRELRFRLRSLGFEAQLASLDRPEARFYSDTWSCNGLIELRNGPLNRAAIWLDNTQYHVGSFLAYGVRDSRLLPTVRIAPTVVTEFPLFWRAAGISWRSLDSDGSGPDYLSGLALARSFTENKTLQDLMLKTHCRVDSIRTNRSLSCWEIRVELTLAVLATGWRFVTRETWSCYEEIGRLLLAPFPKIEEIDTLPQRIQDTIEDVAQAAKDDFRPGPLL